MKIVLINGVNHKGSTYHIARAVAEKACDDYWHAKGWCGKVRPWKQKFMAFLMA